jgi:RHS repeat-associated protein
VDLFAFKINYNTVQAGITDVAPLFNGNIAETYWKTASDNIERAYGYQYDKLNRLKSAIYEKNALTTNAYNESLTYDKNGNIMSLARKGDTDPQVQPIQIDDLLYTYPASSNQLSKADDISNNTSGFNDFNKIGDDYTYDANGNMITDKNKNITAIEYNHLNLPEKITFGTTGTIEYIYNAAGQKLEKIVTQGTIVNTTNYLGGFQYKDNVLEFFPTAEGYVKNTAGVYSYVFQYKDHLGNIRVSYAKNPTINVLEIIDENNYYPFGLKHTGYNGLLGNNNKYKYNGKELQDELGLNFYDYGTRNYDPAVGRWMNIDPLAEQGRRWSPYNYAMDNPVYFIDPDGMWPDNPFTGLIDRAKSAVRNYVANKVSTVVSNIRNEVAQKASAILDKITPDIKIGKPEKARKASGSGVSFATEGGKSGGLTTDQAGRETKQVDMSAVIGLTDVYGPPTTVPGVAPDGSNPFVKTPDGGEEVKSESTMSKSKEGDYVTIETENSRAVPAMGINPSQVQTFKKDTIVKRGDINKVRANDAKEKSKAYDEAKKNNSSR